MRCNVIILPRVLRSFERSLYCKLSNVIPLVLNSFVTLSYRLCTLPVAHLSRHFSFHLTSPQLLLLSFVVWARIKRLCFALQLQHVEVNRCVSILFHNTLALFSLILQTVLKACVKDFHGYVATHRYTTTQSRLNSAHCVQLFSYSNVATRHRNVDWHVNEFGDKPNKWKYCPWWAFGGKSWPSICRKLLSVCAMNTTEGKK